MDAFNELAGSEIEADMEVVYWFRPLKSTDRVNDTTSVETTASSINIGLEKSEVLYAV